MIVYAMIVRCCDGMPLTASLDHHEEQTTVRNVKLVARQVRKLDDRCTMQLSDCHSLHVTTSLGVSYMAVCEANYPVVLAFSFLDEIVREFLTTYTKRDVDLAPRPYAFIRFDGVVQKARQRYNNPSSLATKVDLADLSVEIRLRPPRQLALRDILPATNGVAATAIDSHSVGGSMPRLRPQPLTWFDVASLMLCASCVAFNVVRGIAALSQSTFDGGTSPWYGSLFLVEASVQLSQILLLLNWFPSRLLLPGTAVSFLLLCLCNLSSWLVRDSWQILLHAAVAAAVACRVVVRLRQPRKSANYNV